MTEYGYDLYPRDDPRDGTRLVRYTYADLIAAHYQDVVGVGAGQAAIWVDHAGAEHIDKRGEQYIRVVRLGGVEAVVGGIWTSKLPFETAVASERRHLTISGPGQMAYLARARMAPHTYIHDVFTGQDPFDGMWRLSAQSTVFANGSYLGAMLWRVIYEAQHFRNTATYTHKHADGVIYNDAHADDRLVSRIPDLVPGFDQFEDSNGNAWTLTAGEFSAQVGESVLGVVQRLMQSGLSVWMDPHTFTLYAWEGRPATKLGRSTDRTGAAWGASIVRFQSPTDDTTATGNILSDATRVVNAYLPQGPIWVGGNDVYHKETGAADALYEGFVHSTAEDDAALATIGAAQSTAREEAADVGQLRVVLGDDPTNGAYLPGEHYRLDELARVNTGTGEFDYDEMNYPVGAWRISLPEGSAEWEAHVDLGASYEEARSREFAISPIGSHTHPPNPRLCEPGQPWTLPIEFLITQRWEDLHDGAERQFDVRFRNGVDVPRMRVMWTYVLATTSLMLQVQGTDQDSNDTSFGLTAEVISPVEGVDFLTRFRVEATEIMAKVWAVGDVEPGAWQVTVSDGGFSLTELGVSIINRLEDLFTTQYPSPTSFFTDSIQIVSGFGLGGFDRFTVASAGSWGNSEINGNAWETDQTFAASVGVTGGEAFYTASNAADDSLSSALIIPGTDGDCAEPIGPVCHVGSSGKAARCDHVHTADAANVSYSGTATGDTVEEALDSLVLAAASPTFVSIAKYLTD